MTVRKQSYRTDCGRPRARPRGKPNPREYPFVIDYFSSSCTAVELVRFCTPFQRREWWRWKALWEFQVRIGHHRRLRHGGDELLRQPMGVHEALEAWQAGEITYRRAMRLLGVDTIADLYDAARRSGIPIRRGLTPAEERLAARSTDLIGQRLGREPAMKRWDRTGKSMVDAPDVDAFLSDVVAACRKHGMSLGHEDEEGAFEVYRSVEPEAIRWLMAAHVLAKFEEEDEQ